jgi:hypothetical protein
MREDENQICVLTWHGVFEPSRWDRWLRAQRHRRACELVARQIALKEAGPKHQAYFKKHRRKLIAVAAALIVSSPSFERWRFPQR